MCERRVCRWGDVSQSEVLVGQVGQFTPLALVERDVAEEVPALEPVYDIAHAIRLLIQVWRIDLSDIPRQDDLGILSSPRDNGLDLMCCQVLGFVNDNKSIGD